MFTGKTGADIHLQDKDTLQNGPVNREYVAKLQQWRTQMGLRYFAMK